MKYDSIKNKLGKLWSGFQKNLDRLEKKRNKIFNLFPTANFKPIKSLYESEWQEAELEEEPEEEPVELFEEYFDTGTYYQCPIDDDIFHIDDLIIIDGIKYCPEHPETEVSEVPALNSSNTVYHTGWSGQVMGSSIYPPSLYGKHIWSRSDGYYEIYRSGASTAMVDWEFLQENGKFKINLNTEITGYAHSYLNIQYRTGSSKTLPVNSILTIEGVSFSGSHAQVIIKIPIQLRIWQKTDLGSIYKRSTNLTLYFYSQSGGVYRTAGSNGRYYYVASESYYCNPGVRLLYNVGTSIQCGSRAWYAIEDKSIGIVDALKYQWGIEESDANLPTSIDDVESGEEFIYNIATRSNIVIDCLTSVDDGKTSDTSSFLNFQIDTLKITGEEEPEEATYCKFTYDILSDTLTIPNNSIEHLEMAIISKMEESYRLINLEEDSIKNGFVLIKVGENKYKIRANGDIFKDKSSGISCNTLVYPQVKMIINYLNQKDYPENKKITWVRG